MKKLKERTLVQHTREKILIWKALVIIITLFLYSSILSGNTGTVKDTLPDNSDKRSCHRLRMKDLSAGRRFIHRADMEVRPGFIIRSNPFLKGENENLRPIKNSFSAHLKYSFQSQADTYADRIFGGSYQGIGVAYYTFNEKKQLGDPIAFYIFQGARIAKISRQLSFHYEWNFGLSTGWHPYDEYNNSYNTIIGSKINAYINTNFYLDWMLSRKFDLATGVTLTHFSNGNTRFPNAGLNTFGFKTGLIYYFNRENRFVPASTFHPPIPGFPRHISYDLILFGSWRRKGVALGEDHFALSNSYTVLGFNFAPMYNLGYRFRAGVSLDGFYDGSANIYAEDYIVGTMPDFLKPPLHKQLALGLSGRTEYVMPYFSVNLGMGVNVLHSGNDLKRFYQVLALKIEVTRSSFIHIGYSLQNFNTPNFLMLGIGLRFNNKYPTFCR
ncbi:MAG: acyloxyacyl hydrolase [Tannerella sp.]|jgi:hypothetical protein|nr:acyloxyacyl hydrolase [Tannerella sp.]